MRTRLVDYVSNQNGRTALTREMSHPLPFVSLCINYSRELLRNQTRSLAIKPKAACNEVVSKDGFHFINNANW